MNNLRRLAILVTLTKCFVGSCFQVHVNCRGRETMPFCTNNNGINKSTQLNLFWKGNNDKKKEKDESANSQNTKQMSNMGSTATTMENFKASQELGKKTNSLIQELSSSQVEGVSAKGKIKVFVDGQQQPMSVDIDDDYFKHAELEDFAEQLLIAMNEAYSNSIQLQEDKMQSLYSALGLPPTR